MARKFLYIVAAVVVLVIVCGFVLRAWWWELSEYTLVPDTEFSEPAPMAADAYADPAMWIARPGMEGENPARWQPAFAEGSTPAEPEQATGDDATAPAPAYAVFFVHPTSYIPVRFLNDMHWNARLDDAEANAQALMFVKGMASPFNHAAEIWIPRYRQAVFGSFLTADPQAARAIDAAYADVEQAFFHFLDHADPNLPIVLAGHSQGALHIQRLLARRIAGTPIQQRIAGAYSLGWPVSLEHDLPSLGLPACTDANQPACLMSWLTFGEPAEPGQMLGHYAREKGFDGKDRSGSPILCTNPITGTKDGQAPAADNPGSLVPDTDLDSGELVAGSIGARCDERGLLLIGAPIELERYVLPGNNYHVYDVPMFWRSLQLDAERRVAAWQTARR